MKFTLNWYFLKSFTLIILLLSSVIARSEIKSCEELSVDLEAERYLKKAREHLYHYQYDSSTGFYLKVIENKDSSYHASALLGLARINLFQLNVNLAEQYLQKAAKRMTADETDSLKYVFQLNEVLLKILKRFPEPANLLTQFINQTPENIHDVLIAYEWKSEVLIGEGAYEEAKLTLEKAFSIQKKYHSDTKKYWFNFMLQKADLMFSTSNIKEAINIYEEEVIPPLKTSNEGWARYMLAETYRVSAMLYVAIKKYNIALDYNFQYLTIIKGIHSAEYFRFGEVYSSISKIYKQLGFYSLAEEYGDKSASVYMSMGNNDDLFFVRKNYSKALKLLKSGRTSEALDKLNLITDLVSDDSRIKYYRLETLLKKIEIYNKEENYNQSVKIYGQAVLYLNNFDLRNQKIQLFRVGYTYLNTLVALEQTQEINSMFAKLVALIKEGTYVRNSNYISFFNKLSKHLMEQNRPDSVYTITGNVLKRYRKKLNNPDQDFINNELIHLARTSYLHGISFQEISSEGRNVQYLMESLTLFDQAVKWYMLMKRGYKPLEDDVYFDASNIDIFEKAIQTSYELYRETADHTFLNQAFQYTEWAKSNQLLESLNRSQLLQNNSLPDSLLINLRSLKAQVSYFKTEKRKLSLKKDLLASDSARLQNFNAMILNSEESMRLAMLYLEKNFQNYYQVNYAERNTSLLEVQSHLKETEALIEYFEGTQFIYAFVISKDTFACKQLKVLPKKLIVQFRNNLIPDSTELQIDELYQLYIKDAYELYESLLNKPLAVLPLNANIDKLYFVPDKTLNFIPFEQLLTKKVATTNLEGYGNLPYLLKKYSVSYGYSAAVLFQTNPVTGKFKGKLLAFAPSYEGLLKDSLKMNQFGEFRNNLTLLKHNQSEVRAISEYFSGETFTAENATEEMFESHLENFDIIHLAMHGLVDNESPEYSRLVFTVDEQDSAYDNYLYNFELYNMNIKAQLAVLSACNTGSGKLLGGEGAMSIARAFTYAGVQSVVMSQWSADDQSTSEIMNSFYKYLAKGLSKDMALRKAKLDFLKYAHPLKQNPFYWNNFIITGDVTPVKIQKEINYLLWIFVIFLSVLLLTWFLKRK